MSDNISLLLESTKKINSLIVSLTRCLILGLLAYFVDGIQYRELKAALNISDGKLIANLNQLKTMGYIDKSEAEIDRKTVDVYTLTKEGRTELNKIVEWMDLIKHTIVEGNEKCKTHLTK